MSAFIGAHDRITAYRLPRYAPQLNAVEGICFLLRRRCQANIAFTGPAQRRGLREVRDEEPSRVAHPYKLANAASPRFHFAPPVRCPFASARQRQSS
ncbi:hypothetical protein ACNPQM_24525 [Streptomyces sp. NPDC056231]|uniref:hypothetical protein n=1 Tax=Streptomyces sp. NPDC056231 TaxID=3345755 RepID=UPI003AB091CD